MPHKDRVTIYKNDAGDYEVPSNLERDDEIFYAHDRDDANRHAVLLYGWQVSIMFKTGTYGRAR